MITASNKYLSVWNEANLAANKNAFYPQPIKTFFDRSNFRLTLSMEFVLSIFLTYLRQSGGVEISAELIKEGIQIIIADNALPVSTVVKLLVTNGQVGFCLREKGRAMNLWEKWSSRCRCIFRSFS